MERLINFIIDRTQKKMYRQRNFNALIKNENLFELNKKATYRMLNLLP